MLCHSGSFGRSIPHSHFARTPRNQKIPATWRPGNALDSSPSGDPGGSLDRRLRRARRQRRQAPIQPQPQVIHSTPLPRGNDRPYGDHTQEPVQRTRGTGRLSASTFNGPTENDGKGSRPTREPGTKEGSHVPHRDHHYKPSSQAAVAACPQQPSTRAGPRKCGRLWSKPEASSKHCGGTSAGAPSGSPMRVAMPKCMPGSVVRAERGAGSAVDPRAASHLIEARGTRPGIDDELAAQAT
ncbi:hypothetical protein BX257_1323 [Streptomyces sp. 3212.3]|nr:hypothetical protein BX257_1323 [Streptomyces sp. 3212.3]